MKISLFFATVSGYLAAFGVIDRPQTPQERDYVIETLRLPGGADGVLLDAELTLPRGEDKVPAIVLITGSGPQNKDEELVGHKPFLVLSDHLTRAGYGVLRYDDRGHGKSTGDYASATASDFAADAAAALSFLQSHHRVDADQTGYLGHSEGGYIAPLAHLHTPASFQVFLAGPALPLLPDVMTTQVTDIALSQAADPETILREANLVRDLTEAIRAADTPADLELKLPPLLKQAGADKATTRENLAVWATPWAIEYAHYDPRTALRSLDVPVLALFGEHDLQVSAKQNAPVMRALLKHPNSQSVVLPGLNHLFQPTTTGRISEYLQIKTTIDPLALEAVTLWLDKVTASR